MFGFWRRILNGPIYNVRVYSRTRRFDAKLRNDRTHKFDAKFTYGVSQKFFRLFILFFSSFDRFECFMSDSWVSTSVLGCFAKKKKATTKTLSEHKRRWFKNFKEYPRFFAEIIFHPVALENVSFIRVKWASRRIFQSHFFHISIFHAKRSFHSF